MAIDVLRVVSELEDLKINKIVPLYMIGSKTPKILHDRLYW